MMELLSILARGTCLNCDGKITKFVGEWSAPYWSHEENRMATCPGSPVAEPIPESVQEVSVDGQG